MADPRDIVAAAKPGSRVVGWMLAPAERTDLLRRFVPRHGHVVADHVTLAANVASDTPLPDALPAAIVGHAGDRNGVEALVVSIGGSTDRPDGSTYHVTWSLGPGRRAKEINDVIARLGWTPLGEPLPVTLIPGFLP